MEKSKTEKQNREPIRNKREAEEQIRREAILSLTAVFLFFFWWFIGAFGKADSTKYILGLPEWFFCGAVLGLVFFTVLVWAIVKFLFREIEPEEEDER